MKNSDILTNEKLIKLGFKEVGLDVLDRPIFRISVPQHEVRGYYAFEIQVILSPAYPETNPNSGIVSIHSPKCEAMGIPPDLHKKDVWSEEDKTRASEYRIPLKEWTQPIAWFVTSESRLRKICLSIAEFELPKIEEDNQDNDDNFFMPPDNGDFEWTIGANSFSRKEVAHLLYTQRAMIANDLKINCGDNLTTEMFAVLDKPRTPTF